MGRLRPPQVRPRARDSYLHRSGLRPSPAAGCSPHRRSGADGSCGLSCSSLGRTSAWWGAATAGADALPSPSTGHSVNPETPAGRRRERDLRGGAEPAGEGRGRRPGGAGRRGRRARWLRAGGFAPPALYQRTATRRPTASGQRCFPSVPLGPPRPLSGGSKARGACPTAIPGSRGTGNSSGRAPWEIRERAWEGVKESGSCRVQPRPSAGVRSHSMGWAHRSSMFASAPAAAAPAERAHGKVY